MLKGKPSRPILIEAEVFLIQKTTRVVLYLEDNGESPIKQANIELANSSFFNDTNQIRNILGIFFFTMKQNYKLTKWMNFIY